MGLYEWMKNLAVFYMLLAVVMNLVAGSGYERYIRLYLGILLIIMLANPLLTFWTKNGTYAQDVLEKKIEEEMERVQNEWEESFLEHKP